MNEHCAHALGAVSFIFFNSKNSFKQSYNDKNKNKNIYLGLKLLNNFYKINI